MRSASRYKGAPPFDEIEPPEKSARTVKVRLSKPKEPRGPRDEEPRIEVRNPRYNGATPEDVARALARPATRAEGGSRKGGRSER